MDHRVGSHHRVRGRQRGRRHQLGQLLQDLRERVRDTHPRLAIDRLPNRGADPRAPRERAPHLRNPHRGQRAVHRDREPHHDRARDGHPRELAHHHGDGDRQAPRARVLRPDRHALRETGELDAVRAQRVGGDPGRGGGRLLRLHRLRRGVHGGGGGAQPEARSSHRDHRLPRGVHDHLRDRGRGVHRDHPLSRSEGDAGHSAGGTAHPGSPVRQHRELGERGGRDRRLRLGGRPHRGSAGVPARTAAHLLLDGA